MSNYEHKAREMVAKADKKLKGYSFLGGMGAKYDDAAELLESAHRNSSDFVNSCFGFVVGCLTSS